ncbi:TBPIP-like protein [Teratosphaeria nubilosa]|uniref:TBPIP-like protein n=1 Tax=Teratosphaeria nubilosa TaxID=161662 RepID=A0A6G1L8Z1_9PEZI|nr:TBPIP-like protein [Teratosphaeria nubilosa]
MAPTKKDDKEAKLTPEQSAALVLDYLRKQNRPYSATDISTNLKNRVTKTAATKLLKDMHERKEVEGRAAGKQIVYHAIQEEPEEDDVGKLQEMDEKTKNLRDATAALKVAEKELRLAVREGAAQVPLHELKDNVAGLALQKQDIMARLEKLKSGNVKPVNVAEREKIGMDHRQWEKTAGVRKKIRNVMWAMIKGSLEKEKCEETAEALGLEL